MFFYFLGEPSRGEKKKMTGKARTSPQQRRAASQAFNRVLEAVANFAQIDSHAVILRNRQLMLLSKSIQMRKTDRKVDIRIQGIRPGGLEKKVDTDTVTDSAKIKEFLSQQFKLIKNIETITKQIFLENDKEKPISAVCTLDEKKADVQAEQKKAPRSLDDRVNSILHNKWINKEDSSREQQKKLVSRGARNPDVLVRKMPNYITGGYISDQDKQLAAVLSGDTRKKEENPREKGNEPWPKKSILKKGKTPQPSSSATAVDQEDQFLRGRQMERTSARRSRSRSPLRAIKRELSPTYSPTSPTYGGITPKKEATICLLCGKEHAVWGITLPPPPPPPPSTRLDEQACEILHAVGSYTNRDNQSGEHKTPRQSCMEYIEDDRTTARPVYSPAYAGPMFGRPRSTSSERSSSSLYRYPQRSRSRSNDGSLASTTLPLRSDRSVASTPESQREYTVPFPDPDEDIIVID
jgi:hypothetical protein